MAGVIFSGELCQAAGKQLTSIFENLFKVLMAITSLAIAPHVMNKVFGALVILVCISLQPTKNPVPICELRHSHCS
jgi:hypothetical protein